MSLLNKHFGILVFLCIAAVASAQDVKTDSTISEENKVKEYEIEPRKAALKSTILPGWGQAYNHQYYKIPLVYGAVGGLAYLAYTNNANYKEFRTDYFWSVDDDPLTNPINSTYRSATLKLKRDDYRKNRDMYTLFTIGAYGLNILDAYVFGHLKGFNQQMNDDLSMGVVPVIFTNIASAPAMGIKVHLSF